MKRFHYNRWVIMVLCFAIIFSQTAILKPIQVFAANTGTVTATSLNVRSGPGTDYSKVLVNGNGCFLRQNEKVTIIEDLGEWYQISFQFSGVTTNGYVMKQYVKVGNSPDVTPTPTPTPTLTPTPTAAPTPKPTDTGTETGSKAQLKTAAIVTASNLNVRKTPSITSSKVSSLKKNNKITVLNEVIKNSEKWYQISYKATTLGTVTGYVLSDFIKLNITSSIKANINSGKNIKIRKGAGVAYTYLTNTKGKQIQLSNGAYINITQEITDKSQEKWFKIFFYISKVKYSGYVLADQVLLKASTEETTVTVTPTPIVTEALTPTPTPTLKPTVSVTIVPTKTPTISVTVAPTKAPNLTPTVTPIITQAPILSEADFEQKLITEGFPESYKPMLRQLHQLYPTWVFEAYQTGLDWNTVIDRESTLGLNLISNAKSVEWKSLDMGAYNWSTDKFIPFDGSTWVTASRPAVAYYMDPRNFLTDRGIFQFELLTYKCEYQNAVGVEGILFNTPLYNTSYSYTDDAGNVTSITYADTFIKAAEYSGVSPYHLASRAKQEVVTGTTSLSSSVSGVVAGFEGLYNFFNIGAYNSTVAGGAVANGLKYARNGTTSPELNALYRIPWDSPYDSIVGGAYSIGRNYINRGQNTIYLQKFNVSTTSTFSHQYMANLQAPEAEAKKTFTAYSGMMNVPIVFSIPVYLNMPEIQSVLPATVLNPNNWLKTLVVNGYSLTPTFDMTLDQPYSLIVDNSVASIDISASTVSAKAVLAGTGTIPLMTGSNTVIISVTAENGSIRQYIINVVREEAVQ